MASCQYLEQSTIQVDKQVMTLNIKDSNNIISAF